MRPLGYLMPDPTYQEWVFRHDADLPAVAVELADAAEQFGLPFAEHWTDWAVYASRIEASGLLLEIDRTHVLPAVALLDGDPERARRLVDDECPRIGDAPDPYSTSYRAFVQRVRELAG